MTRLPPSTLLPRRKARVVPRVSALPSVVPTAAAVFPARPNPFVPRVELPFDVPAGGDRVRIRVFDVGGREVRVLTDGDFLAGSYRISWDGRTATGQRLAPGVYFARTEIGSRLFVQKLTMLD